MARSELQLSDVLKLSQLPESEASETLARVYEWKYEHALGRAKALAGLGSALLIATILPAFQQQDAVLTNWPILWATWGSCAVLIGMGATVYLRARRFHVEYIGSRTLLHDVRPLQGFVAAYRSGQRDA